MRNKCSPYFPRSFTPRKVIGIMGVFYAAFESDARRHLVSITEAIDFEQFARYN